jgi:lipid-A-disaccharide synthase-like uncharacterized protein
MRTETFWIFIGMFGQGMFFMRFLIQWLQSERKRKSFIPVGFWYFSLFGGLILLIYAIHRRDPVFVTGQAMGTFIYLRNLQLIHMEKKNKPVSDEDCVH